jgi:hypothetical protein
VIRYWPFGDWRIDAAAVCIQVHPKFAMRQLGLSVAVSTNTLQDAYSLAHELAIESDPSIAKSAHCAKAGLLLNTDSGFSILN